MSAWVLLAALCLAGCTGWLVEALEERQVQSCLYVSGPLGGSGILATGGVPLTTCLAVPCPCALAR